MNKNYKALDFDRILLLLREQTTCAEAGELAVCLEPSCDLASVELLLNQTDDAFLLLAKFGAPSFSGLKNMNNAAARAEAGGLLNTRELLDIAETLRCIRALTEWRAHCSGVKSCLDRYFECLTPNKYLENRINQVIISEEEISDNASEELADIRKKKKSASLRVKEQLDKMVRSQHYQKFLQDPIVTMRNGRYVVPVKNEFRAEIQGLVHDSSSSGATVFVEPIGVVEANNQIRVLENKERVEIERILYELSAEAGSFSDSIRSSFDCGVQLNLIFAKAHLAYKMKASRPVVNSRGTVNLKNARHPLIDKNKVVPVNVMLGDTFDALIITGPNTGGKTVSIKTVGLLTLMTMCGLLIPVSDQSEISVFHKILVDIGDEQSIEQSLSTFSAHMTNIISIMEEADDKSLVLIDELGAGTDPVEGAALAVSILEDIRAKGAKIAATTHYAELKAYALQTPRVVNGCCEFDVETLKPTYKLLIGVPGRSNAFAISDHLGMDKGVIERAKALVSEENKRFEQVVEKLEISRQSMESEKSKASQLYAQAQAAYEKAKAEKARMDSDREKEIEMARAEGRRIIESARQQSNELIAQLDLLRKEKAAVESAEFARKAKSEIKAKLNAFEDLINPVEVRETEDEEYTLPRPLEIGDRVYVRALQKEGEVLSCSDKGGNIEIQSGAMKLRVKQEGLRLLGRKQEKPQKTSVIRKNTDRANVQVNQSCDLRGKVVEEALMELDLFIDRCQLSGISEFTVIHGKGTGALRKAVQEYLRHHQCVRTYRLGVYGEGENGVTIVTLK